MPEKHTYDFVKHFLLDQGIHLLNDIYYNANTLLTIKCLICKYKWENNFNHLFNGSQNCPKCSGYAQHTYSEVQKFLYCKNILLLSKKYVNAHSKLRLKCLLRRCGYKWKTCFHYLKNDNTGCPKCANHISKTYKEVKSLLFKKKIILLDNFYINDHTNMRLKCIQCKYKWKAIFNRAHKEKYGCPKCYGNAKFTQKEVAKFLLSKNIELLDIYRNINSIIKVRCIKCNLIWDAKLVNLRKSISGCAICDKKYYNEKITGIFLSFILPDIEILQQKNIKCDNKIDKEYIYVDYYFEINNKKIIIEYNGAQHYEYNNFFHRNNKNNFLKQKKRDRWLKQYCKNNKINLIIIDGREYKNDMIYAFLNEMLLTKEVIGSII